MSPDLKRRSLWLLHGRHGCRVITGPAQGNLSTEELGLVHPSLTFQMDHGGGLQEALLLSQRGHRDMQLWFCVPIAQLCPPLSTGSEASVRTADSE